MTTSIVLYGEIDKLDTNKWLKFYNYSKKLCTEMSFEPNYIGLIGEEFKTGKVLTIRRTEKRLLKSITNGNSLTSMSLYSLPDEFTQAAFDYNFYISRNLNEHNQKPSKIILTLPTEIYEKINTDCVISNLKDFIQFKEGEIFDLSRFETPMIYASKVNDINSFESLKIISIF